MCTVLLPPGGNPVAVNIDIIINSYNLLKCIIYCVGGMQISLNFQAGGMYDYHWSFAVLIHCSWVVMIWVLCVLELHCWLPVFRVWGSCISNLHALKILDLEGKWRLLFSSLHSCMCALPLPLCVSCTHLQPPFCSLCERSRQIRVTRRAL